MRNKLTLLQSTAFLAGLFLLLVNDFVLKAAFCNWWTGKLSDFAGLFIFPLFWTALFPGKKNAAFAATLLGFLWWKTPLSQGIIDGWNEWMFFKISRVVDYSDYVALLVLPLAYQYESSAFRRLRLSPVLVLAVSAFAFMASGGGHNHGIEKETTYTHPPIYISKVRLTYDEIDMPGIPETLPPRWYIDSSVVILRDSLLLYRPVAYDDPQQEERLLKDRYTEAREKQKLYADLNQENSFDKPIPTGTYKDQLFSRVHDAGRDIEHWENITTWSVRDTLFGELQELNFHKSLLHGKQTYFRSSGKIRLVAHYKMGIEEGEWEYFNENQRLEKKEYYTAGELIRTVTYNIDTGVEEITTYATRRTTIMKNLFILVLLAVPFFGLLLPLYHSFRNKTQYLYNDGAMVLLHIALAIVQILICTGIAYLVISYTALQQTNEIFFWKLMIFEIIVFLVYHSRKRNFTDWLLLILWMVAAYLGISQLLVVLALVG